MSDKFVFVEKWDTEALIIFLREQELKVDEGVFSILRKAKVSGQRFLMMNKDEFIEAGVAFGPAIILANEAESLKNRTNRSFSSYRTIEDVFKLYKISGDSIIDIPQFEPVTHKLKDNNSSLRFCVEDVKRKLENMGKIIDQSAEEILCITEGKPHQLKMGVLQNIMQCKALCESNRKNKKRKIDETLDYEYVYGIVSTGTEWIFLLHTTDSIYCASQKVYHIPLYENSLKDDTELRCKIKEILETIIGILEDRANVDSSPVKKKQRIEEFGKK
ncbi:hypothetical protein C2G38_2031366 [Gigaspora rosea]|uniref:SAM domain-containing protein n=1 Tax=Gigaspora rosea TaxID=44941 RepID=A0A397VTG5_9GLOM|nr:hypothetical protein C2G38_2031366 [Gigaspora rosea]